MGCHSLFVVLSWPCHLRQSGQTAACCTCWRGPVSASRLQLLSVDSHQRPVDRNLCPTHSGAPGKRFFRLQSCLVRILLPIRSLPNRRTSGRTTPPSSDLPP